MAKVSVRTFAAASLANIIRGKAMKTRAEFSRRLMQTWKDQVDRTLRLSDKGKHRYKANIIPYKEPKAGAYIKDKVTVLLERGWRKFGMKPGLLQGMARRVIPIVTDEGVVFRTVTQDSQGWIHPGYGGGHLEHRVRRSVPKILKDLINQAMKGK